MRTKKPVNCFLHDDAIMGMWSPQTSIIKNSVQRRSFKEAEK